MKPSLIFILLLFSFPLFSQTESVTDTVSADEKVYEMFDVQTPPQFPGGPKELAAYLSQNINYPAEASKKNISGVVAVTYVVNKDGSVSDISIIKDIGGGCGEEARRVVQAMPLWKPGEVNGQSVRVRYTLPVRFRL